MKPAALALENGLVFRGFACGAEGEAVGEVVFNTAMTGYQEILTDPSYRGQIVVMTYPLIGNYGVNPEDVESHRPWVEGFIVKEMARRHSNCRATGSLREYLIENRIVAIEGVDTRMLVRAIREAGAMRGVISTADLDETSLVATARAHPTLVGRDLVREVTVEAPYAWRDGRPAPLAFGRPAWDDRPDDLRPRVVAFDTGIKWNILRRLVVAGIQVSVVPAKTSASQALAWDPDGIFLANGPGDPAPLDYIIRTAEALLEERPIFGICLGHQILGQAFGGTTFKLKFGHHGANQPVLDHATGRILITSQNHGFAVAPESLPPDIEVTQTNLNDGTCEGLRHTRLPVFCVQYHPEASPGPHDARYLFDEFVRLMGPRLAARRAISATSAGS